MNASNSVIAVTGASGLIGQYVVRQLLANGFRVRCLVRRSIPVSNDRLEIVLGDLMNREALRTFLSGATYLVHCAGEIHDLEKMRRINTDAAVLLMQVALEESVKGFCHISSAGVVGTPASPEVDESIICKPNNIYEESKWFAEKDLMNLAEDSPLKLWILRPTNVVDSKHLGVLAPILSGGFRSMMHLWIKGGERAHIVHATDVAAAAIYLILSNVATPGVYFIGYDEDARNRFLDLRQMDDKFRGKKSCLGFFLPPFVSWLLRTLRRGQSLRPNTRFSSSKLLQAGFIFPLGLEGAVKELSMRSETQHK